MIRMQSLVGLVLGIYCLLFLALSGRNQSPSSTALAPLNTTEIPMSPDPPSDPASATVLGEWIGSMDLATGENSLTPITDSAHLVFGPGSRVMTAEVQKVFNDTFLQSTGGHTFASVSLKIQLTNNTNGVIGQNQNGSLTGVVLQLRPFNETEDSPRRYCPTELTTYGQPICVESNTSTQLSGTGKSGRHDGTDPVYMSYIPRDGSNLAAPDELTAPELGEATRLVRQAGLSIGLGDSADFGLRFRYLQDVPGSGQPGVTRFKYRFRIVANKQVLNPNIVLILTDDQRWDTLAYMPTVRDQLQTQGITFTQSFVTTPLCCPSRSSILTGLYAHNHEVRQNFPPDGGFPKFKDASTLAVWLKQAGYQTALVGKYLNAYNQSTYVPPGWDEWDAFTIDNYFNYQLSENGVSVSYGSQSDDYSTDVLSEKALKFIRGNLTQTQPFFLYFAPNAPHRPFIPAPRHQGLFASLPLWRPPSFNEVDISDKPFWLQGTELNVPNIDRIRLQQLESLLAVDDAVKQMIQLVQSAGQMNNTLWI